MEKKSKNNIQWKLGHSLVNQDKCVRMQVESNGLEQKENHLDEMIKTIRHELNSQFENTQCAYLTNLDIMKLPVFKDQTVIIIKAPPEAKLVVFVTTLFGNCFVFINEISILATRFTEPSRNTSESRQRR